MHTDQRLTLRLVTGAWLTMLALSCGGSSPAGPSPQNQNPPPAAAPSLAAVSPGRGATGGGLAVTITGSGFVAGASVSIGGAAASAISVASATSITATTPAHAAGAADVVVTNPDGQSGRLSAAFTYETPASPPPAISSVGPSSGPAGGGTSVSIAGSGFTAGATVAFGASAASSVNVASATSITAVAPAGNAGKVDVVVTNPDGQTGRMAEAFTYVTQGPPSPPAPGPGPAAPTLSGVSPSSGTTAGGTVVTLSGSGFASGATVTFGGTAASGVSVASATSITATTPARAAGAVEVVVTNPDGQTARLGGGFTYEAPAPPPGQVVVITITSAGVSPSTITISPGTRVRFVNNDAVPHEMSSDPHPSHVACPALNQVGLLLAGQSRESTAFTAVQTCGYHDHRDPDEARWTGTIVIR